MEILINPNVSYVLMVLGFLTAVLALFSPGTGFLEFGALSALALAGYGAANQPVNTWAFVFVALGVILFCLVLVIPPKNKALFMTSASVAFLLGATFLFRSSTSWLPTVNPVLILLIAPSTVVLSWFISKRIVESAISVPAFNPDRLIGMTGQASSDIRGRGSVYVNGEEWSAQSPTFIPAGSNIRVLRRQGLLLEVEPLKQ